ncbi:DUF4998 domain-containing protein [Sphingobacterium sp. SYP-B4668]|uniref:DUF4998 domain-containing protein n=1 Tax=Sphingobacterium sp. SYP-B4668 TaxID=2996035 RepID=UPI0022DE809C|nr:DUF4998 domain-containing protein [Sphingobacterium sp. SYP-B4668]
MKSLYKFSYISILILMGGIGLGACSKMNDLHDVYLKKGEQIYVGQPDSVKAYSGDGRVLIKYWNSDPKSKKITIYWNTRHDSVLLDIPAKDRKDAVEVWIDNLEEKNYSFELITMNANFQHRSIPLEINTKIFGVNFQESIQNRKLNYLIREAMDAPLQIGWFGAVENSIGLNLVYTNTANRLVDTIVAADQSLTELKDYKNNLKYRTIFIPNENVVDSFYTEFKDISPQVESPISKSSFSKWNPNGIPYGDAGATYDITKLWNGHPDQFFVFPMPAGLPHSFTFDIGVEKKLSRIRHWQRLTTSVVYAQQNSRRFEIWGSASPEVTADFSGWIRLGTFEVIKPSGSGSVSAADLAYASKGEDFKLDPNAPPVRYIRYVVLSTWNANPTHGAVGEVTFFQFEQ